MLACAAAMGLLVVACGSDPQPEPETPADVAAGSNTAAAGQNDKDDEGQSDTKGPVSIDPKIVALCDLGEPKFDFDSAAVSQQAAGVLDKLAECFISGKGQGKNIRLVGHADQRGETEYNFGLGQRRAGSVAQYLQKKGLGKDRMTSMSRGELDATGSDEEGWAKDRRVDILLAE
ncbi:MAG: OmpA family protein [Deltaproteobacteria bacterium]|nr:OmpA family protein [Deltaproteobacteria bacterium]MBW2535879.1 OmpA family protein [Deltaproteobacteria bacterium]